MNAAHDPAKKASAPPPAAPAPEAGAGPKERASEDPAPEGASAAPAPAEPASGPAADLAGARAQVKELEDRLRRQQAEFVNDLRRIQRQADERVKYAAQAVVEDLLGVADALHGAIEGLKDTEHERRVAEGLHLVERQLLEGFARHGLVRIEAVDKPFDPAFHEAILELPSPGPEGVVLSVVRPGFLLHGRLIRAAHVIVSKRQGPAEGVAAAAPTDAAKKPADGPGPEKA